MLGIDPVVLPDATVMLGRVKQHQTTHIGCFEADDLGQVNTYLAELYWVIDLIL